MAFDTIVKLDYLVKTTPFTFEDWSLSMQKTCLSCGRKYHNEVDLMQYTSRWRKCDQRNLWFNCSCGSTLMLPEGEYPWYEPTRQLTANASFIFNKLSVDKNLPAIKNAVMRLIQVVDQSQSSSKEVADVAKESPSIAAYILALASNLKIAEDTPVRTLEHAISLVGRKTIKELALISAIKEFDRLAEGFDRRKFWKLALASGMVGEHLAKRFCPHLAQDEVYVSACLGNSGKLVQAILIPEDVTKWSEIQANTRPPMNWRHYEFEAAVPAHTTLGEIACALWGLPVYAIETASNHHNLNMLMLRGSTAGITDLSATAIQIVNYIEIAPSVANDKILRRFRRLFSLDDDVFNALLDECHVYLERAELISSDS